MDIAKVVFETIDKVFDKSQNNSVSFDGEENIVIEQDVVYSEKNEKYCKLDFYYIPQNKDKYPVIINIHGGGFMAGGKEFRKALAKWFAINGFFVANVNYGLCPECAFPEPLEHLVDALNYVVKSAKKYNLDAKKLVVAGDSAGAHYACALANVCTDKELQEILRVKPKGKFAGAILNCGLYDFQLCVKNRMAFNLSKKVLESYTGIKEDQLEVYEFQDLCSPINFVSKKFPPTFVVFADKDIFCKGQGELLIQKLTEKDVYFEAYHTTGLFQNHCFSLEWKSKEAQNANSMISEFLNKIKNNNIPCCLSKAENKIFEKD